MLKVFCNEEQGYIYLYKNCDWGSLLGSFVIAKSHLIFDKKSSKLQKNTFLFHYFLKKRQNITIINFYF